MISLGTPQLRGGVHIFFFYKVSFVKHSSVHEQVQPLQERTQNQDTCPQGLLCLTAKSQLRCSHISQL